MNKAKEQGQILDTSKYTREQWEHTKGEFVSKLNKYRAIEREEHLANILYFFFVF